MIFENFFLIEITLIDSLLSLFKHFYLILILIAISIILLFIIKENKYVFIIPIVIALLILVGLNYNNWNIIILTSGCVPIEEIRPVSNVTLVRFDCGIREINFILDNLYKSLFIIYSLIISILAVVIFILETGFGKIKI